MIRKFHIPFALLLICLSPALFGQVKSEEVLLTNDGIELPGTLSYSKTNVPLLIWIHGSGNVDRNGNQAGMNVGANYIQQFREAVTKNDLAFYSFDKRTANQKNMQLMVEKGVVFEDLVTDVKTAIRHFKNDKRFSSIVLIGHSQGSLLGMLASELSDKYICLAGPAESIDKTIIRQVSNQSKELGELCKSHFKELKETGEIKDISPLLLSLFAKQNQSFLRTWMAYNPAEEIKKIEQPILLIQGDKDLQVTVKDAEQLKAANPDAVLKIIKDMNHVLKTITKEEDNIKSYQSANYPISEELISTILGFVKE